MPGTSSRQAIPWLVVVRWEYDGSENNGMPQTEESQGMLMLEAALGKIERPAFCVEAYRRIGAGIREFVYYVVDTDKFLEEFIDYVAGDPLYPIEIKFYKDEAWSDLQDLIDDFKLVRHSRSRLDYEGRVWGGSDLSSGRLSKSCPRLSVLFSPFSLFSPDMAGVPQRVIREIITRSPKKCYY
ncbi:DUF695 domain-containing protein [Massilia pseudoviolaceinigra]|uniref:DUF695 domain-containing protein n=1 Tax=Massilia pseudoviolaceinigra TaxID=3057165 RepID=UPI0035B5345D